MNTKIQQIHMKQRSLCLKDIMQHSKTGICEQSHEHMQ